MEEDGGSGLPDGLFWIMASFCAYAESVGLAMREVGLFDDDIDFNVNTTSELIDNAKYLIDTFYKKGLTFTEAMECVTDYRYDDDCINEGIQEMWDDYCKENNIFKD